MAVLIHFIFSLIKIAMLASIYASIVVLTVSLIAPRISPEVSEFRRGLWRPNHIKYLLAKTPAKGRKRRIWLVSGAIISVGLFILMFSHWGDHGFGDSARIPLEYGREVNQTDGSWTYITPEGYEYEVISLKQFSFNKDYLVGHVEEPKIAEYVIWNLASNQVEFTDSLKKKYSSNLIFKDFYNHYQDYWGGWRFWLLA